MEALKIGVRRWAAMLETFQGTTRKVVTASRAGTAPVALIQLETSPAAL